ncbi:MAG: hypothetical protein NUW37_02170 [Planctomycetes bacterium]|nr:hypothetical protein [Planctomycetota bacterium]
MPIVKKLRCKKSKIWLPDEHLTAVHGNCDRGTFKITTEFTFRGAVNEVGDFVIDSVVDEGLIVPYEQLSLSKIVCSKCAGPVEWADIDEAELLTKVRSREVDMLMAIEEKERDKNS